MSPSDNQIIASLRAALHIVEHSPHFLPESLAVQEFKANVEGLIDEIEAKDE